MNLPGANELYNYHVKVQAFSPSRPQAIIWTNDG